MTRNEVKHYIKLILKVHKESGIDVDSMTENIINAVSDSWFFSWHSFIVGLWAGVVFVLIAMSIK